MTLNNKQILLVLVLLGVCLSQKISLPIKSTNGAPTVTSTFGTQKCSVDMKLNFDYCTTNVYLPLDVIKSCGTKFISDQAGYYYSDAFFSLNTANADLEFASPKEYNPDSGLKSSFCLHVQDNDISNINTVVELYNQKLIKEKQVFLGFNKSPIQSNAATVIGQLDIGMPDVAQYNGKFTELDGYGYHLKTSKSVTLFGAAIYDRQSIFLSMDSPYTQVSTTAFEYILSLFKQKGIAYTQTADSVTLPSIANLDAIVLNADIYNGTDSYTIKLLPSKFTKYLDNGNKYELLIKQNILDRPTMTLGNTIFESYYVGFDIVSGRTSFAEKRISNEAKNFRGESQ